MTVTPPTIYLKDYTVPEYIIPDLTLDFDIQEQCVVTKSTLHIQRNVPELTPLKLNGLELKLVSLKIDSKVLEQSEYNIDGDMLTILNVPQDFTLEVTTELNPELNKSMEGLYQSGDILCTQNEAEGFRRITYFTDRPDVMSVYTTTITADKKKYPVLLSNGNFVEQHDLANDRHSITYRDPFPKPCYLFALVAGDLGKVADTYVTTSGKNVDLAFYVDKGNEPRVPYALESLKRSMKWDEDTFGLECDLDSYVIVAVDAFNAGAMENKGLNIFNSKYVLAAPESAADNDYLQIEGVIGHEYFHNWTGNRVTCRDWFQLTLKEGLTVFRDQEFSSDMNSRAVKRISDVQCLREHQFSEDSGPMSHPIRPESYIKIDNFYTATVYNKGAEVIRMIHTLIGADLFRKGIDKYFELYDGQAVTTDDFLNAMQQASGRDLTQFKNWYDQNGTPVCEVRSEYDDAKNELRLTVSQTCSTFDDGTMKQPFHFPLKMALINSDGSEIPVECPENECALSPVLEITEREQSFVFIDIESRPTLSLLRDFSAPVKLKYDYTQGELIFLLSNDTNEFARYDASQKLLLNHFLDLVDLDRKGGALSSDTKIFDALGSVLNDPNIDRAFCSDILSPPTLTSIVDQMEVCDYHTAYRIRKFFSREFAAYHEQNLLKLYKESKSESYSNEGSEIAKRSFKNICLSYLSKLDNKYVDLIFDQFNSADNMTDSITSLSILCGMECDVKNEAISAFYKKWESDPLVINKWFTAQAMANDSNIFQTIKKLEASSAFDAENPNKIRALYGAFSMNYIYFHSKDGAGYELLADKIIEIDAFNSSIAARLAGAFEKYSLISPEQQQLMKAQLERILAAEHLSAGVYEVISRTVKG